MSNEKKTAVRKSKTTSSEYVHVPRVASFKKAENKAGFLTPVNKRAHKLTHKLGKRLYVKAADLKQFDGYYDIKVYTKTGVRRSLSA